MKNKLAELFLFMAVMALISVPFFWVLATVSACGWKGLFVECRITEVK